MTLPSPYCQSDSDVAKFRAHGCGLFVLLWLQHVATNGNLSPDAQAAIDTQAQQLLNRSGASDAEFLSRGTTLDECERAYEHVASIAEYKSVDRVAPEMRKFHGGSIRGDLIPLLSQGAEAMVAVNYGKVQDAGKGVGSYRGGHWVGVARTEVGPFTVADPLRRGLVEWSVDLLESAAETFGKNPWGNGRGEFGVVEYAPTFLERAEERIEKLKDQLAEERAEHDATTQNLVASELELLRTKKKLEACEAETPDCTAQCQQERARTLDDVIAAVERLR